MGVSLPPGNNQDSLKRELALVPARRRDDAIQEAWVAHLSGKDPIAAIKKFAVREHRYAARHIQIETIDGEDFACERDGTLTPLTTETPAPRQSILRAKAQAESRKLAG